MGVAPYPDDKFGYIQRIDAKTGEAKTLYTEAGGRSCQLERHRVRYTRRVLLHRSWQAVCPASRSWRALLCSAAWIESGRNRLPDAHPDGCAVSPDGEDALCRAYRRPGWAFDIEAPGVLRKPGPHAHHSGRIIAGLPGSARFDSLAVLAKGNIAVATLNTGYVTEFAGRRDRPGGEDAGY